jgi:hypothetical protein
MASRGSLSAYRSNCGRVDVVRPRDLLLVSGIFQSLTSYVDTVKD